MVSINWEPVELALIEEVREQIESPNDNLRLVFEKLIKGMDLKPEPYYIKRILIGLTLLDTRQFNFYEVTVNARTIFGIKDSQSDWSVKIHQTSAAISLKNDLKEILNLDEPTVDEIIRRTV